MSNPRVIPGLTTVTSQLGHAETLERFERAVHAKGMTVFARIDHHAGAAAVDLELPPTVVVIFGDARAGTRLMQLGQTIGIDLPLKVLVWQDAAKQTWLSYNDPAELAKRHAIDAAKIVTAMATVLADLTREATVKT